MRCQLPADASQTLKDLRNAIHREVNKRPGLTADYAGAADVRCTLTFDGAQRVLAEMVGPDGGQETVDLANGTEAAAAKLANWLAGRAKQVQPHAALTALTNPSATIGLQLYANRKPPEGANLPLYEAGDPIKFGLKATDDCRYYLLAVRPDGTAELWFEGDLTKDKVALVPKAGDSFWLVKPSGLYTMKLIVTRSPLPAPALTAAKVPRADALRGTPAGDWAETSVRFRIK